MSRRRDRGFTLIEVLVAIVVFAFGVLALARLQMKTSVASTEAVQRAQAIQLVQDMVDRINANRHDADAYVQESELATSGEAGNCAELAERPARDVCEWTNLLRGLTAADGSSPVGSVLGARGCISRLTDASGAAVARSYVVAVSWQGLAQTAAPRNGCGSGQFDDESKRRAYAHTLNIANLAAVP